MDINTLCLAGAALILLVGIICYSMGISHGKKSRMTNPNFTPPAEEPPQKTPQEIKDLQLAKDLISDLELTLRPIISPGDSPESSKYLFSDDSGDVYCIFHIIDWSDNEDGSVQVETNSDYATVSDIRLLKLQAKLKALQPKL